MSATKFISGAVFSLSVAGTVALGPLHAQASSGGPPRASTDAAIMERARSDVQKVMEPLQWLVGEWEGPAQLSFGEGQKMTITQRESVVSAAFGTALIIRGSGSFRTTAGEREVFQAAALLSYDLKTRTYLFASSSGAGVAGSYQASVDGSVLTWSYIDPEGAHTRYVISRTDDDKWQETGEVSRDGGSSWKQNFVMTLNRKK